MSPENAPSPEIPDYAKRQMVLRGISADEVRSLLTSVEPFDYNQKGRRHSGYYDDSTRLFVAVVADRVVTAFKTRPSYVERLKRRAV